MLPVTSLSAGSTGSGPPGQDAPSPMGGQPRGPGFFSGDVKRLATSGVPFLRGSSGRECLCSVGEVRWVMFGRGGLSVEEMQGGPGWACMSLHLLQPPGQQSCERGGWKTPLLWQSES